MSKKQKFVSLADVVTNLADDPKVKAIFAKELKLKKESPARHERKFNLDLMNLSMEINHCCKMVGVITEHVLDPNSGLCEKEMNFMFDERMKLINQLSTAQNKYDALVRELDQAIIDEDLNKVS